jgi:hypothetical protein
VENGVQVARAMKYAGDLNAFQYLPVKNDVPAYGETSQAYFEFVTRSAYIWLCPAKA